MSSKTKQLDPTKMGANAIYTNLCDLYDSLENQTWMSIEQRDTLLNTLAVFIAQYEGVVRWIVGEIEDAE